MPVPMIPSAKSANAKSPAIGRSASAAWRVVWMSTTPCWLSVIAVASMTQKAITFENTMPTVVSSLMR